MRRLISSDPSEVLSYSATELKASILSSEGRTICCETVAGHQPLIDDLTNAEVATAYGANLILLNGVDVLNPEIKGLPNTAQADPVHALKKLIGRPIGVNLEPVDANLTMVGAKNTIASGRICSVETLQAANKLGLDFVCLTGNPGSGVSNPQILNGIRTAKENFDGLIIAGKMHAGGSSEPVVPDDKELIAFIDAGADIILIPAVGTVPGFTEQMAWQATQLIKSHGALVMSAIGTSQEGADTATIREIALTNKRVGVDIQHIGDGGFSGIAIVDNIYQLSLTVRGIRHTISCIARSTNR